MKAMMAFAAGSVPGAVVQATAKASWHRPHAPTPSRVIKRRSRWRTKKRLLMTPRRPMQLTMAE
jgi:hypothetical protein